MTTETREVWFFDRDMQQVRKVNIVPMRGTLKVKDEYRWWTIVGDGTSGRLETDFFEDEYKAVRYAIDEADNIIDQWETAKSVFEDREAEIEEERCAEATLGYTGIAEKVGAVEVAAPDLGEAVRRFHENA